MRPRSLDDYVGQTHLVGPGAVLRRMIDSGRLSSFILWGPPGTGKTTLAQIVATRLDLPFSTLSAVTAGVKEVREVIDRARTNPLFRTKGSHILFIYGLTDCISNNTDNFIIKFLNRKKRHSTIS